MAKKIDHKMRMGKREIPQSICDDKNCEFFGKSAAQGVCFAVLNKKTSDYCQRVMQRGEDLLAEMRGLRKVNKWQTEKAWIRALEGHLTMTWANYTFNLDELIHLRGENYKLRLKLGKHK